MDIPVEPIPNRRTPLYAAFSVALVVVIGLADYSTGYSLSFLAFYLLPVGMCAWFVSSRSGVVMSFVCIAVWLVGDIAAGANYASVLIPIWNGLIGLTSYIVVVLTLGSLRKLQRELENRVRQRTAALTSEMQERARLEKELLDISEREQRRIGHDLHDVICQHLTATAMAGQVLSEKLAASSLPETADAREVVKLIGESLTLTRNLAHGISPSEIESDGLATALHAFAGSTSRLYRLQCTFATEAPIDVTDPATATHLYRIAQEAVANAIRHGKARQIVIGLFNRKSSVELTVEDDGGGLPEDWQKTRGLGTRIMAHRASMIGGVFSIEPNPTGGTFVKCTVSASPNPVPAA